MSQVEKWPLDQADEAALHPYLALLARRAALLPSVSLTSPSGAKSGVRLADVFVPLQVGSAIHLGQKEVAGQSWLGFSDAALAHIHTHKQLVLLGEAGSGKSTLLRYLMYCLAQARLSPPTQAAARLSWLVEFFKKELVENLPLNRPNTLSIARQNSARFNAPESIKKSWQDGLPIPVWVQLRQFAATTFAPDSPLAVWQYIEAVLRHEGMTAVLPLLRQQAEYGNVLLLLDGVDEIPNDKREAVWRAIAALRQGNYGGNRWLATCRTFSFVASEVPEQAAVQTVQPLTQAQIEAFIANWQTMLVAQGQLNGPEAERLAEDCRAATRGRVSELATNPNLLTTILLARAFYGELPPEPASFYQVCVAVMLRRWGQHQAAASGTNSRTLLHQLNVAEVDLEKMLAEIAWTAHSQNVASLDTAVLSQTALRQIVQQPNYFGDDLARADTFVNATQELSHLLTFKGSQPEPLYTFPNRTFQEFLAARYLLSTPQALRRLAELASGGEPWRDLLNLAVGYCVFVEKEEKTAVALIKSVMLWAIPDVADLNGWHRVWLAGEMAATMERHRLQTATGGSEILQVLVEQLAALLAAGVLTLRQRAEIREVLAQLREPHPHVVCAVPAVVAVPAGAFWLGSDNQKDREAFDEEMPPHEVWLPTYRIGQYAVTNAQFARFIQAGGYDHEVYWTKAGWAERQKQGWQVPRLYDDPRYNRASQPVVGVSWYEAVAYCTWLKTNNGRDFRLPDEAMWEKAARSTKGQIFPWGDLWDAAKLNSLETRILRPLTVGGYPAGASPYGAFDMCGNVWEWCSTVWDDYPFVKRPYSDEIELPGPRLLRGGSLLDDWRSSRAATRHSYEPEFRGWTIGFRVAEALPVVES